MRISTVHLRFGGGRISKYAETIAPDAEKLVRDKFGSLLKPSTWSSTGTSARWTTW